jgi:hypothetical protein
MSWQSGCSTAGFAAEKRRRSVGVESHFPSRRFATGAMARKQPQDAKYERRQKHDQAIDVDRHRFNSACAFQTRHPPPHLDAHPEQWHEHAEQNPSDADEDYGQKR